MITLTQMIYATIIIIVVVALIVSGKLRALGKAFLNLFVEDLAASPEGAEALFNQKIEEVEDKYRKANDVFSRIAGERTNCKKQVENLNARLKRVESVCEQLAQAQDVESLKIKASERAEIVEEIKLHEETLVTLEAALKDATEARNACEENLNELRKQKKQVVTKMKRNRDMKAVYDDLNGIGAGDHTSKLLDKVIERGTDLNNLVTGSKEAYDSKTSTKSRKIDQKLSASENDAYVQSLLGKYSKKS